MTQIDKTFPTLRLLFLYLNSEDGRMCTERKHYHLFLQRDRSSHRLCRQLQREDSPEEAVC